MKEKPENLAIAGTIWLNRADNRYLGGDRIRLLEKIDELGSISQAAKAVGISYKTAWDMVNLINNLSEKPLVERQTGGKGGGGARLTPAGRSVVGQFGIIAEEHRKYLANLEGRLDDVGSLTKFLRRISMKVSARNVFAGSVAKVAKGAVNAEISLAIKGGATITAIVTNGAVDNLGLKEGVDAYAIIKASSIILGTDLHDAKVSARNIFCGTVSKVIDGPVSSEVDIEIGGGNTISAVITRESSRSLELKVGGHACALFKASSVILGVS